MRFSTLSSTITFGTLWPYHGIRALCLSGWMDLLLALLLVCCPPLRAFWPSPSAPCIILCEQRSVFAALIHQCLSHQVQWGSRHSISRAARSCASVMAPMLAWSIAPHFPASTWRFRCSRLTRKPLWSTLCPLTMIFALGPRPQRPRHRRSLPPFGPQLWPPQ